MDPTLIRIQCPYQNYMDPNTTTNPLGDGDRKICIPAENVKYAQLNHSSFINS